MDNKELRIMELEVEEQTTGAFVGSIFGVVGENTELDNLIEGFIQGKKPREKFS